MATTPPPEPLRRRVETGWRITPMLFVTPPRDDHGVDRGERPQRGGDGPPWTGTRESAVTERAAGRGEAGRGAAGEAGRGDGDDLAAIMRRMAEGDDAAVVTLYERYGGPIAAAVQRVVRLRQSHVDRDDLDGIVFEVCFELASVAAAWSPDGGALPWVWARRRVANVVDRVLGQWAEPLDEATAGGGHGRAGAGRRMGGERGPCCRPSPAWSPTWRAPACCPRRSTGRISTRDRELLFEYAYEKHSGNRSPAATVAPEFGMREVSVRQAFRRARQRLLRLAARDERFALSPTCRCWHEGRRRRCEAAPPAGSGTRPRAWVPDRAPDRPVGRARRGAAHPGRGWPPPCCCCAGWPVTIAPAFARRLGVPEPELDRPRAGPRPRSGVPPRLRAVPDLVDWAWVDAGAARQGFW